MCRTDVVVVSYNSRDTLRACVEPLAHAESIDVVVVDNASSDGSADSVRDLPLRVIERQNDGFGAGCNAGWRAGSAPTVLFLNPDARVTLEALHGLAAELERDPGLGAVAPRVRRADGALDFSLRRFPRLRSTFARAIFAHRLFPHAGWADEVVRDPSAYERPGYADWVSGACMLVRREALELLEGFDERFFMYCEDTDLCRRLWNAGRPVRFVPDAEVVHEGGRSAPRWTLLPVLVASRIRYMRKHRGPAAAATERVGLALEAAIRLAVGQGGLPARRGHAAALRCALGRLQTYPPG